MHLNDCTGYRTQNPCISSIRALARRGANYASQQAVLRVADLALGTDARTVAFSVYVYSSNARFRQHTFAERLAHKAAVTQQILALDDAIAGQAIIALPEQVEQVFAPTGQRVYTSQPVSGFTPPAAFLARVRRRSRVSFAYPSPQHNRPQEGTGGAAGIGRVAQVQAGLHHGLARQPARGSSTRRPKI